MDVMCVTKIMGCETSHKHTNIHNLYSIKYHKHVTKQYYRSFHIKNSTTEQKESVFKYFLKATINFAFSFLGTVSLCHKMLKILKPVENAFF